MQAPGSKKQLEYWANATHRWNVKTGATRSGKTYLDYFLIPRRLLAVEGKEGLNVILGNTRETVRRNVLLPMQSIYGENRVGNIRSDNSCMMFGQQVFIMGADNVNHVDKLRGTGIKYCYGDEVVTWKQDVFDMLKSRLDKSYSKFDGTCNPDGPEHWFYKFLQSEADIYQQTYSIDDNPYLPEDVKENIKLEYQGSVLYDRYVNGLWVAAEGALFTTYPEYTDDETLLRDGIAHIDAAYGGEDYTAFTCAKRTGDSITLYGKIWHQHVDTVLDFCISEAKRLMCAPILTETNADKGYLAKEIHRKGYRALTYAEDMNKFVKISTYLRKWWKNIRFLHGTDKSYVGQIMSYTIEAEHDDAPDSAANVCRWYDPRSGAKYKSAFGG